MKSRSITELIVRCVIRYSVILGILMGLLSLQFVKESPIRSAEDEALGAATTSVFLQASGRKVHCRDLRDADECVEGIVQERNKTLGIWLGNSMLHAVNQYKEGDLTAPFLLHQSGLRRDRYIVTLSQPNANFQEHFLLFKYLTELAQIDFLILPAVFDDTREDGIRGTLQDIFVQTSLVEDLRSSATGARLVQQYSDKEEPSDSDIEGVAGTIQEHSERFLNHMLNGHSDLWSSRPELRAQIFIALYKFRNALFGINPSSKRKKIPGPYSRNLSALEDMLRDAASKNIQVFIYIPPIRHDAEWPYVLSEYESFKAEVKRLAERNGAISIDFEKIIPDVYWGLKETTNAAGGLEIDFMHFQAKGHEILARAIEASLFEGRVEGVIE